MLKLFYCPPVEPGVYFRALKDTNKNAVPAFTLKRRSVVVSENTFHGESAAEKVGVHPILVWWTIGGVCIFESFISFIAVCGIGKVFATLSLKSVHRTDFTFAVR